MTLTLHADPLPLRLDESGTVRVGKSNVTLDLVIEEYQAGHSPEWIVDGYDTLNLADIHAVFAYYLRHKEDVDAYLAEREREAAELYQKLVKSGMTDPEFGQKLRARRAAMEKVDAPVAGR